MSLAQKPKSAVGGKTLIEIGVFRGGQIDQLTDFHITTRIKKDIITFDVAMNYVLAVKMGETFTGLMRC